MTLENTPTDWQNEANNQYGPRPVADLEIIVDGIDIYNEGHRIIETGSVDRQLEKWGSQGTALAGDITLRLVNTDGRFNPKNNLSPYFPDGLIGQTAKVYSYFYDGDTRNCFGPHLFFGAPFFDSYSTERVLHFTGTIVSVMVNNEYEAILTVRDSVQTILETIIETAFDETGNPAEVLRSAIETYTSLTVGDTDYDKAFNNLDWITIRATADVNTSLIDLVQSISKGANLNIFTNELDEIVIYALYPDAEDFVSVGQDDFNIAHYSGDITASGANIVGLEGGHDIDSIINVITYTYMDIVTEAEASLTVSDADSIAQHGERTLQIDSGIFVNSQQADVVVSQILERFKTPRRIYSLSTSLFKAVVNEIGDNIRITDPATGETGDLFLITKYGIDIENGAINIEVQDIEDFDGVKWGRVSSEGLEPDGERISAIMDAVPNKDCASAVNPGVDDSLEKWNITESSGTWEFTRTSDEKHSGRYSGLLHLDSGDGNAELDLMLRGGQYLDLYKGRGLGFDGTNEYVDFGNIGGGSGYTNITIKLLIADDDLTQSGKFVLSKDAAGVNTGDASLKVSSGVFSFVDEFNGITLTGPGHSDNDKHLIIVTYDTAVGYRMYMDGVLVDSDNTTGLTLWDNATALQLGSYLGGTSSANIKADDLDIWDRTLTADEIDELWNNGYMMAVYPGKIFRSTTTDMGSNLELCAKLDEQGLETAKDISGNGNDGTLTNMEEVDRIDGFIGWEGLAPREQHTLSFWVKGAVSVGQLNVEILDVFGTVLGTVALTGTYSDWTEKTLSFISGVAGIHKLRIDNTGATTADLYIDDIQIDESVILNGGIEFGTNGQVPIGWTEVQDSGTVTFRKSAGDSRSGSFSSLLSASAGNGKFYSSIKYEMLGTHTLKFWIKGQLIDDIEVSIREGNLTPLDISSILTIPAGSYFSWTEFSLEFKVSDGDEQNPVIYVDLAPSVTATLYFDDFTIDDDYWPFQSNWKLFGFIGEEEDEDYPGYDFDGNQDGDIDDINFLTGWEQLHVTTN